MAALCISDCIAIMFFLPKNVKIPNPIQKNNNSVIALQLFEDMKKYGEKYP
jgi:hypothetical protein